MRKFATISVFLHIALVVVGYFGLPSFQRDMGPVDIPVTVEILTVTSATNVPVMTKAEETPELKPEPKPAPPPQATKAPPPPPPAPEPEPAPPSQTALVVEPDTRPKPKAKEKPKAEDQPVRKQPKPRRKPKAPTPVDPFTSVLKTLDEMKNRPKVDKTEKVEKPEEETPPEKTFEETMAAALETQTLRKDLGPSLTISEIDLVRQQIARCWALPAGAKDAHEMTVELRVMLAPDGAVQGATIENQSLMAVDPFYKAMAESALRAVLKCSPLKLPEDKYEDWRDLKLSFNPKEMFGL